MNPNHQNSAFRIVARLKTAILVLFVSSLLSASANAQTKEINTADVLGQDIWQELEKYYYQVLYDKVGDISTKLFSVSDFRMDLTEGRVLLRQDATHLMLADHFGITAQASVPVGSVLNFGGSLGAFLMRYRQVPDPQAGNTQHTLSQDLSGWDPHKKLASPASFQTNISPWIDAVIADVKAGNMDVAKNILPPETPEQQYLDLLAGLKLPFEMPWTAERFLDGNKVKVGDLASFAATGGIFARLGGTGWNSIGSPWVGMFLNGQFHFGIFKISPTKALLRVDTMKQEGINWDAFQFKYSLPISNGVIFGKTQNLKVSFSPFTVTGQSYDSQLFARTYELDFSSPKVAEAYNAAVHGNLTLLDDMGSKCGQDVKILSERFDSGHYNQSQINFHLGPIQFQNVYSNANVEEDWWDERGSFTYLTANSTRINYNDVNLLLFKIRQTRTNNLTTQAYPLSPQGVLPPRLTWTFDEVNFEATANDQKQILDFIQSLRPMAVGMATELAKHTTYHAGFKIQVHPQGILDFENHTPDQVWQAASKILYGNSTVWQDAKTRSAWLAANTSDDAQGSSSDLANYYQVEHWANAFKKPPPPEDIKTWFANLIEWQRSSYWDILGVKLFLTLVDPAHRYLSLDFEDDNGSTYSFTDGTNDLTAYPDDWEYLTIPPIAL